MQDDDLSQGNFNPPRRAALVPSAPPGSRSVRDLERENDRLRKLLNRALLGLKDGADLAYATETTDSCHGRASVVGPRIEEIEAEVKAALLPSNNIIRGTNEKTKSP